MEFRFALLHRSFSYWLTLALFALANIWSWLRQRISEPECCDQIIAIGFPFPFHTSGALAGSDDFLVTGLLLDIVIAWTMAVIAAWIALMIRPGTESMKN